MTFASGGKGAVVAANAKSDQAKQRSLETRADLHNAKQQEEERAVWSHARLFLYTAVSSRACETTVGVIIFLNMILVILETDAVAYHGEAPLWMKIATQIFLGIYSIELIVKLYVYRLTYFSEMWNNLDAIIVGVDLIFLAISMFVDDLASVSVLRIFRLVRLARIFKAAKSMRELHSLLRSVTCALKAIFWGMVLMSITLTVWGILAVQLIHPINLRVAEKSPWLYSGCDRCSRSFSTVFDSVLTIWKQIVAGDSWGQLSEPIIEEERWTFAFFVMVFVTVALTMLNCILAVVVEAGAAAAAQDEHEMAVEQEKNVIRAEEKFMGLCQDLDTNGNDTLCIREFMDGFNHNDEFRECLEVMHITDDDIHMIFNICDEDGSGDVDYKEFVNQLRRIKVSGEQMLLHYVTDLRHMCHSIGVHLSIPNLKDPWKNDPARKEQKQRRRSLLVEEQKHDASKHAELEASASSVAVGQAPASPVTVGGGTGPLERQKMQAGKFNGSNKDDNDNDTKFRLERIRKMNEDVVNIMGDVARQSKEQTTLLRALVDGCQGGISQVKQPPGLGDLLSSPAFSVPLIPL